MQKVLLGYSHSHGVIKDSGLPFDNINLYVGDIDDGVLDNGGCVGIAPYPDPIKIKTAEFRNIVGMTFEEFCAKFEALQFCPVLDSYGLNRYKRPILSMVRFGDRDGVVEDEEV